MIRGGVLWFARERETGWASADELGASSVCAGTTERRTELRLPVADVYSFLKNSSR